VRKTSQIIIDKATTVPRTKLGSRIGRLESDSLRSVERALQAFLSLEGTAGAAV
jgi:mRNA interferase MazF